MADEENNVPERMPEQPRLPFVEDAGTGYNLHKELRGALSEMLTPRKGQAASYLTCDGMLTYVGATNDSTLLVVAGIASLSGSAINTFYVGGNIPRLVQAYAILRTRELYAYLQRSKDDNKPIIYPSFLSENAFEAAIIKAKPRPLPDVGEGHASEYAWALRFYTIAGLCFIWAGATGTGFDQLLSFMKGDGVVGSAEKIITGAVNTASVGYGILFALGNSMNLAHKYYPTKMKFRSALIRASQERGLMNKWQSFCDHAHITHASSNTLLVASTSWLIAGGALLAGGMMVGAVPMIQAGGLLTCAAMISYLGDYCARLEENHALSFKMPWKKSPVRFYARAYKRMSYLTRRAARPITKLPRKISERFRLRM